jgi:hypothetical protein
MDAGPSALGVYVVVHVAMPEPPLSVHGLVPNVPPPSVDVKLTSPLGVIGVPVSLSVTVAVHVTDPLIPSDDGHESDVEVVRAVTVTEVEPVLIAWALSPP